MKQVLLSLFLITFLFSEVATLIEKRGIVKIKHKNSIKKSSIKINQKIEGGDTIFTYNSIAVIKLKDGSIIKLAPHSQLQFYKNRVQQIAGEVYFKIKKRNINKLNITTDFTTIGVKGTTFIVDDAEIEAVILKKGKLQFKSPDKQKYIIHSFKKIDSTPKNFSEFKKMQMQEFQNYKRQMYKEFIEFKAQFYLTSNKEVLFKENDEVYKKNIDKNSLHKFDIFENNFSLKNFGIKSEKNRESEKEAIKNWSNETWDINKRKLLDEELEKIIEREFQNKR